MCLHPDYSEMFRQRQDRPIPKMTVKRDQYSLLLHSPFKNQRVVSPFVAGLGRANDIMSGITQKRGQFDPQHLIEVKAHGGLGDT